MPVVVMGYTDQLQCKINKYADTDAFPEPDRQSVKIAKEIIVSGAFQESCDEGADHYYHGKGGIYA